MVKRSISIALSISLASMPYAQGETTSSLTSGNDPCPLQINCQTTTGNTTVTKETQLRPTGGLVSETEGSGVTTVKTQYEEVGGAGDGVYDQAAGAESQSLAAQMLGTLIAATNLPSCGRPGGQAQCMLGMAGLGLAMMGAGGAASSQYTQDQMGTEGTTTDKTVGTTDTSIAGGDLNKLKADYAKAGYKTDANGNTVLPNGKSITGDMDKAALMTAGVSSADADKYLKGLKDLKAQVDEKLKTAQLASGAGGGGPGSIQGAVGSGGGDPSAESVQVASGDDRDPASWNGYYKKFGDSVIGVSQSDIFGLVENRVGIERKAMGQ